ncbi:MAG: curli assembly protein CsgF [Litorimonas sp.]
MKRRLLTLMLPIGAAVTALGFSIPSAAQDLVYTPINPSFGGNPFNSAHLLAIANAQNDFEPESDEDSTQSDLDRFIRSLQSRLLSSLSTQVANAIFGEDAQDEGTIVFGDQTISFVRGLDGIELTITEGDGSQTVITVPTFTSTAGAVTDTSAQPSTSVQPLTAPATATAPSSSVTAFGLPSTASPQVNQTTGSTSLLSLPPLSQGFGQPIQ